MKNFNSLYDQGSKIFQVCMRFECETHDSSLHRKFKSLPAIFSNGPQIIPPFQANCQTPLYCRRQPVRVVALPILSYATCGKIIYGGFCFDTTPGEHRCIPRPSSSAKFRCLRRQPPLQPPPSFSAPLNDRVSSGKAAQKARSQSTLDGGRRAKERKKEIGRSLGVGGREKEVGGSSEREQPLR